MGASASVGIDGSTLNELTPEDMDLEMDDLAENQSDRSKIRGALIRRYHTCVVVGWSRPTSLPDQIVAHLPTPYLAWPRCSRQTALDNEGATEAAKAQTATGDGKAWPWSHEAGPAEDVIPANGSATERKESSSPGFSLVVLRYTSRQKSRSERRHCRRSKGHYRAVDPGMPVRAVWTGNWVQARVVWVPKPVYATEV